MALVVLSYREVVAVGISAGGSNVVAQGTSSAREWLRRPLVALVIDDAGHAGRSRSPRAPRRSPPPVPGAANSPDDITLISIAIVILTCYGNLRGIERPARVRGPTDLFSAVVILMVVVGLSGEALGDLGRYAYPREGGPTSTGAHGHNTSSLIAFGMVFVLLRAFANGGSSLTGIEAVSNAVSAFQPPEGLTPGGCWSRGPDPGLAGGPRSPGWRTSPTPAPSPPGCRR